MLAEEIELRDYVRSLQEAEARDDSTFHSLLSRGFDLLRLIDKDIAHGFGVSRPTVTRWRNGVNAPHPAMRKPLYVWLEQRAQAVIRSTRRQQSSGRSDSPTPLPMAALGRSV
jgi:hypothetical protein